MTRFARAKGSKACNERQEEEATPWCVMRQQLISQMEHTHFPEPPPNLEQPTKSANSNKGNCKEHWSEFDEPLHKQAITCVAINKQKKVNKIKSKKLNNIVKETSIEISKEVGGSIDPEFQSSLINNKIKNKSKHAIKNEQNTKSMKNATQIRTTEISAITTNKSTKTSVPNKPNQNQTKTLSDNENVFINNIKEVADKSGKIKKTKKKPVNIKIKPLKTQSPTTSNTTGHHTITSKTTASKNITSNWYNQESHTIVANGREIKIVRYDGFFVKQDDAVELKKLRKKLKAQNIPTDKIKMVLKLERRKAEKALAREKSSVCFQCRQFGHNFADCPEIKDSDVSKSGMCFKCGSLEHTHFECKISQNQNFRFAVCFVCKEQGHIARQCSSNPKGQYPKGGACYLCGEITHLRKDCPKAVVEKPTSSMTLVAHSNTSGLEDISHGNVKNTKADDRKTKVVKF